MLPFIMAQMLMKSKSDEQSIDGKGTRFAFVRQVSKIEGRMDSIIVFASTLKI